MPFLYHDDRNQGQAPEVIPMFDLTSSIIAYEQSELNEDDTLTLFQHLVNTGMAWTLQGHYGRTAVALIRAGHITVPNTQEARQ
jgi:hypothetical protein